MKRIGSLFIFFVLFCSACSQLKTKPEEPSSPPVAIATPKPVTKHKKNIPSKAPKFSSEGIDAADFQTSLHDPNWLLIAETNGVKTYQKRNQASDVVTFRGETVIPVSIVKVATVLNSDELRSKWVDSLIEAKTVQQISQTDRIEYNHSKVPWPLQDRDFVYLVNVFLRKDPLEMLIRIKSKTDDRAPPREGIVRAEVEHAYYYLTAVEGMKATKILVEMALDPKGAIPLWLMNVVQKNWPFKTLKSLRKVCEEESIQPSQEIREYFNLTEEAS